MEDLGHLLLRNEATLHRSDKDVVFNVGPIGFSSPDRLLLTLLPPWHR